MNIRIDYAPRTKLDPVETGDRLGNWVFCLTILFGLHYGLFWLAGGQ